MPSMPSSARASFTSSSLKGLMIASSFFIVGKFAKSFVRLILTFDASRFFRSPPSSHRILASRWRGSDARADERGGENENAGGSDHGSRQSFWGDRFLPMRQGSGNQTDHRLRGLHHEWLIQGKTVTRIHLSFHLAGGKRDWLSQFSEADFGGASRWFLLSPADRQGFVGGACRRFDRPERLSRQ